MSDPSLLSSLPPLRDVIEKHGLRAKKSLGQNFLLDLNLTRKIVSKAGDLEGRTVFEIGPGPGGLTRALLESRAEKVIAIEYDPRAAAALEDLATLSPGRLEVVLGDALHTNLLQFPAQGKRVVVANLPYNIATPLFTGWMRQVFEDKENFESLTLMFQKEVAQRLAARTGERAYGRLSVLAQWLCDSEIVMELPPQAFTPPPKVFSSVVRFTPKHRADTARFEDVEALTAAAFGQRRKMIRSSLKPYAGEVAALGLDPQKRAENLSVEEYIVLATLITKSRQSNP